MSSSTDTAIDLGDLEPVSVPYVIGGVSYTLREASSASAAKFRNASVAGAKLADGKIVGIGNVGDVEPLLVSLCLFDKADSPVPLSTVKGWPARIVKVLFEKAKAISQLDDKDEKAGDSTQGKAEPSATDSTSA